MILAQTLTAGAQAVADAIGWSGLASIAGAALAALIAYGRGSRLLAPLVAAIEWFRTDGARGFDLSRYGLSLDMQARLRADLQAYLWASLRDAIAALANQLGLLRPLDARVQAITAPLKALAAKEGAPITVEQKAAALKRTTGVMAAFRPDGLPDLAEGNET